MYKNSFLLLLLCLACSCCPTEDIVTVDLELENVSLEIYSSETFQPIPSEVSINHSAFTIVTNTTSSGLESFEEPKRRFLQSPDCDTSDPTYNINDELVAIDIFPQQNYNADFPANSNMAEAFYSAYLIDNPLRPEPELRPHGSSINIDAFNTYFVQYQDVLRRNQEPIQVYGLKPSIQPSDAVEIIFKVTFHFASGRTLSKMTESVFIEP